jgi:fermentation-respiration switch protein FrsA (DUF1100 family)
MAGPGHRAIAATMTLIVVAGLAGCGSSKASNNSNSSRHFAVGHRLETFTDPSRSTPANGNVPGHPGRTLVTTIYYPATGSPPHPAPGPFPLIVFAHGFTGEGTDYAALLTAWAATGYVVAAPDFPLSSHHAVGGPSIADYFNQPGDLSFVITAMSKLSADHSSSLSGRIELGHLGVAGHSLGGVTTLGLATNTCCRDKRVAAAAAMAGDAVGFQGGAFTTTGTPPLLLLHGDHDQTVPYQASRDVFSSAAPPKLLVTLLGGDHIGPYLLPTTPAFAVVVRTSLDFFDTYLKGERASLGHVERDGQVDGVAKEEQVLRGSAPNPISSTTVIGSPSGPSSPTTRAATAAPDSGLHDGQTIQVSWRGFTPSSSINILECIKSATGPADCDLAHATLFHPAGPNGAGSIPFTVHVGTIGTGRCDSSNSCLIAVNEGGSQGAGATVAAGITFAS